MYLILRLGFSALLLFSTLSITAQFQMGMRSDGYAGVSGLHLQPTSSVLNPFSWDVQLVGAGAFFDNNYAFLQNTGTLDLLRTDEFDFERGSVNDPTGNTIRYTFVNGPRDRFFSNSNYVEGPSATVKIGERHAVGLVTGVRTLVSLFDLPDQFSFDLYENRDLDTPFSVGPFRGAAAGYGELGLNYAFRAPVPSGNVAFGTTVKYLLGYEGLFAANRTDLSYQKVSGDAIEASEVEVAFGFTNGNLNSNGFTLNQNGTGFAVDLGFTYTLDGDYERPYLFRFDAALLDLGMIRFRNNAERHRIQAGVPTEVDTDIFEVVEGIENYQDGIEALSDVVLGDPTASRTGDQFSLLTPARVYLAGDVAITKNFYVQGAFLQSLVLGSQSLRRGAWFGVTPRFQHRWVTVAMPVGVYQYYHLNVGASVRAGFVTVGTDNLPSLFGQQQYHGTDIYFAVRVNPFSLGGGKGGYGRRGKGVKCYDF